MMFQLLFIKGKSKQMGFYLMDLWVFVFLLQVCSKLVETNASSPCLDHILQMDGRLIEPEDPSGLDGLYKHNRSFCPEHARPVLGSNLTEDEIG